jgi:hypothetical protein
LLIIAARPLGVKSPPHVIPADRALARLMEGNKRYSLNKEQHFDESWPFVGKGPSCDKVHNCGIANAQRVARQIRESEPVLRELIEKEAVKVVAADYALHSGIVRLLEMAHP